MEAFRHDGPLMKILTKIANMMLISILWCLCCIPIITIIPACGAAIRTTVQIVRKDGSGVIAAFFRSFIQNLKQGCIASFLVAGSGVILYICLQFGWQNIGTFFGFGYFIIGCGLALIWATSVFCLPAALSKVNASFFVVLRIALYLGMKRILQNIGSIILLVVMVFFVDFYPILLLLIPGVFIDLTCSGTEKALCALLEQLGIAQEDMPIKIEETVVEVPEISALQQAEFLQE